MRQDCPNPVCDEGVLDVGWSNLADSLLGTSCLEEAGIPFQSAPVVGPIEEMKFLAIPRHEDVGMRGKDTM